MTFFSSHISSPVSLLSVCLDILITHSSLCHTLSSLLLLVSPNSHTISLTHLCLLVSSIHLHSSVTSTFTPLLLLSVSSTSFASDTPLSQQSSLLAVTLSSISRTSFASDIFLFVDSLFYLLSSVYKHSLPLSSLFFLSCLFYVIRPITS